MAKRKSQSLTGAGGVGRGLRTKLEEERRRFVIGTLAKMGGQRYLRRLLAKKLDDYIQRAFVEEDSENLRSVQEKKYEFLVAMLHSAVRNMDKGYISRSVITRLTEVFVENCLFGSTGTRQAEISKFEAKYRTKPPSFVVLSPTQKCNLRCKGCYAGSTAQTAATLPYSVVDRLMGEVHDIFGARFITISGGEPLMYQSQGKTLLDLFGHYSDMFFLVYTNGTLITPELGAKLGELGNVTPAISVEGFEKETDDRRGKGTYAKLLRAFRNLRGAGVPFGVSVTATSRNVDLLLTEEFYDFFFKEQGITYMWQFQLMPIGRGRQVLDQVVSPEKRVELYRMWERMLKANKYCVADFWNSGVLSNGCIAYGRDGGYIYIDWDGNVTPCVFIPYYVDNINNLYRDGKTIADALFSRFMKNGRKWQEEYGLANPRMPMNWLMPCSIRDHYECFRTSILPSDVKPENPSAAEILRSHDYYLALSEYDSKLERLTESIWRDEYLEQPKD
jgi:MoaA/NifB/PqqE/SkfB family radical SAM enzyme